MTTSELYDLIVIGGGPAGSAAAIGAARSGARVLLLERGRFPRHKVCGEFVSAESLALLATLLGEENSLLAKAPRISQSRVFADGRTLTIPIAPSAASITRFDLDAALWSIAERSGAEVRQQIVVRSVAGGARFQVSTSTENFQARAVINASGRWSNLTQDAAAVTKGGKWLGVKAHFAEPACEPSVDLYFFDGGYCGVQPIGCGPQENRINACAMVRADVAGSLAGVLACHPALRERSRFWQPRSEPVSTAPLIFRAPRPIQDGMLRVGDAAGFVDPFVGDGISLALRSGTLAAECLQPFFAGNISLAHVSRAYAQSYAQRWGSIFRTSSRIRQATLLPAALRKPILAFLEKSPAVTRYLAAKTR